MLWQSNLYAVPLLVSAALLIVFALVGWRRDTTLLVLLFFVYALFNAGLLISYALQLLSADLALKLFWVKIQHIFYCLPVIWLLFIIIYTGMRSSLSPMSISLLFLIPVIQALAAWTNEFHSLSWSGASLVSAGGMAVLVLQPGPVFYLGMIYLYGVMAAAGLLLVNALLRDRDEYASQRMLMLSALLLPPAANAFTLFGLTSVINFDLTPLGFAAVLVPVGLNLFRQNLFDIVPAAYGKIIESMGDAVIVLNAEDVVVAVNPASEQLTHIPASRMIGHSVQELFPDTIPLMNSLGDDTLRDLVIEEAGRVFDVRVSGIYSHSRRRTGRVVVLRDVTERIRAEETIRAYAEELKISNNELDSFSHTVAHDLKAPLGIMMGYIHILQHHNPNEADSRKYLGNMEKAAMRMENMITGLLMLARLRDIDNAAMPVNTVEAALSALDRFHTLVDERRIRVEIKDDMPPVMGHEIWIEEVFANLIGNALKYIGKDNPAPCVRVSAALLGDQVRFEVQDNGIGIPKENQHQLFTMFSRFHKDEAIGAGLGLSITQRIVTRLKGEIGAQSEPGQGSTFWFTLPAAPEAAQEINNLPA